MEAKKTEVWKYLPSLHKVKRKHFFFVETDKSAICGVTVQWFDPVDWKSDKEGLENRVACQRCMSIKK
jgi:hypothetical protein